MLVLRFLKKSISTDQMTVVGTSEASNPVFVGQLSRKRTPSSPQSPALRDHDRPVVVPQFPHDEQTSVGLLHTFNGQCIVHCNRSIPANTGP